MIILVFDFEQDRVADLVHLVLDLAPVGVMCRGGLFGNSCPIAAATNKAGSSMTIDEY